jgi:hypothetical protein
MFLVAVDWERYVVDAATLKLVGYCVRVIVLFFIGGFVAYLHNDEKQPFKLLEVGMGAPALIAGFITTSLVPSLPSSSNPGAHASASFSIVASAYAQPQTAPDEIKRFTLPAQSPAAQFFEGLLGSQPKNVWFVIVGSHLRVEDAKAQAYRSNGKFRDFKASVYEPYGDNPYYAVVIGANLTQSEAKALRDKAVSAGFPKDSYYKTFPNLPPPVQQ